MRMHKVSVYVFQWPCAIVLQYNNSLMNISQKFRNKIIFIVSRQICLPYRVCQYYHHFTIWGCAISLSQTFSHINNITCTIYRRILPHIAKHRIECATKFTLTNNAVTHWQILKLFLWHMCWMMLCSIYYSKWFQSNIGNNRSVTIFSIAQPYYTHRHTHACTDIHTHARMRTHTHTHTPTHMYKRCAS